MHITNVETLKKNFLKEVFMNSHLIQSDVRTTSEEIKVMSSISTEWSMLQSSNGFFDFPVYLFFLFKA